MKTNYNYENAKVDTKNKKRLVFINTVTFFMQQYDSSSDDVNDLINWLHCMSDDQHYYPIDEIEKDDINIEPAKHIDNNKIIKEVFVNDLHLYSYAMLLHDYVYTQSKDVLYDIIFLLYKKLDEIVHPYEDRNRDLEDIKYFVELDYEPKEQ